MASEKGKVSIGITSTFLSLINFCKISSFSFDKIEQVEYIISWPDFNRVIAFFNKSA